MLMKCTSTSTTATETLRGTTMATGTARPTTFTTTNQRQSGPGYSLRRYVIFIGTYIPYADFQLLAAYFIMPKLLLIRPM